MPKRVNINLVEKLAKFHLINPNFEDGDMMALILGFAKWLHCKGEHIHYFAGHNHHSRYEAAKELVDHWFDFFLELRGISPTSRTDLTPDDKIVRKLRKDLRIDADARIKIVMAAKIIVSQEFADLVHIQYAEQLQEEMNNEMRGIIALKGTHNFQK